jgi:hypothetical protein
VPRLRGLYFNLFFDKRLVTEFLPPSRQKTLSLLNVSQDSTDNLVSTFVFEHDLVVPIDQDTSIDLSRCLYIAVADGSSSHPPLFTDTCYNLAQSNREKIISSFAVHLTIDTNFKDILNNRDSFEFSFLEMDLVDFVKITFLIFLTFFIVST